MIALFISSCGNERLTGTPPSSPSATIATTQMDNAGNSIPTVTSSPRCDSKEPLPLVDAILTSEDMITRYPIFESDDRWLESVDLTRELVDENRCSLDCAKQGWSPITVTIILVKSPTPEKASELVTETRNMLTDAPEITDRPHISQVAPNAWIAYDYSQREFVLLYSYGSIFVHIVNRPHERFDDFAGEFDLTYGLGKTQNEKLCSSGYEP